jgi:hypothetical protein
MREQQSGAADNNQISFRTLTLSGVKGVRLNKETSPKKPPQGTADLSSSLGNRSSKTFINMLKTKSIQNLVGQDEKKINTLFQAIKLVGK